MISFLLLKITFCKSLSGLAFTITFVRIKYAVPHINAIKLYKITGHFWLMFWPNQAVTIGIKESQNSKYMLAHMTVELTYFVAFNKW